MGAHIAAGRSRWPFILLLLAGLNVAALLLHVAMGDYPIPALEALQALFGAGDGTHDLVVNRFRFPRALVSLLAGAALGTAGVILQGITRNPLAAPGVIGLNAGAGLAAVITIVAVPAFPQTFIPFVAFGGACVAAGITYALAWRRGVSPVRLLLIGVAVGTAAKGGVVYLLTFSDIYEAKRAVVWLAGSVYGRSWDHFWPQLPWVVLLFPAAMLLGKRLDLLQLGDELAVGLGVRLERTRGLLLLVAVGLAGSAVATAGTIGFVGLMAPHMARFWVGSSSRRLLPAAALTGGLFVMTADLLGKTVLAPIEIPCGVLIALVGGPYMILQLFRNRNA